MAIECIYIAISNVIIDDNNSAYCHGLRESRIKPKIRKFDLTNKSQYQWVEKWDEPF